MFRLKPLALLIGLLGTTHSYAASNTADLTQSGAQNTAALTQTGQGNHSVQIQLGTDTRQTVLQTGELNAVSIYQGKGPAGLLISISVVKATWWRFIRTPEDGLPWRLRSEAA
ncbi:curlin repeat-containing protein [Pseudomonas sp. WAC2]|uniref:curlin repeat-containing protein n=1 Tax=Pseudomonas sp. WAC2 TaxID=3055057 RepID=UPI0025B27421|nr:curlin repeat-containing protein [Pseudomonas sp. WAC2]MDN3235529.1 curlin repeat-containing protein [Pseudomonas sp. WAC2]